jgi:hypothetical protein
VVCFGKLSLSDIPIRNNQASVVAAVLIVSSKKMGPIMRHQDIPHQSSLNEGVLHVSRWAFHLPKYGNFEN